MPVSSPSLDCELSESRQYPNLAQSLVPNKHSGNTYLTDSACCSYVEWTGLKILTIQIPFKWAFLQVQLDIAGQIHQNQRQIWAKHTRRCHLFHRQGCSPPHCPGALSLPAGASSLPTQSSRPVGTPHRIWASSLRPSQASLQGQVGSAPAIWTASRTTLGIQRPAPVHDPSFLLRLRGHVL